ncbi:MAG: hypothetical protein ACXWJK_13030, partial [Burkholderiaceae bacterium]
ISVPKTPLFVALCWYACPQEGIHIAAIILSKTPPRQPRGNRHQSNANDRLPASVMQALRTIDESLARWTQRKYKLRRYL